MMNWLLYPAFDGATDSMIQTFLNRLIFLFLNNLIRENIEFSDRYRVGVA